MKSLLALSRSVRAAVFLILLITALSIAAACAGFTLFFRSALFLVPVLLFAINLASCAAFRIFRRIRNRAPLRVGPDLVHLGLLVLIAGALLSAFGRTERSWTAGAGDRVALTPSTSLEIVSLQAETWENGTPKDWVSTIRVLDQDASRVVSFPLRVNHPLRVAGLSVYQASWGREGRLEARDASGALVHAVTGQGFEEDGTTWLFADVQSIRTGWTAVFQQIRGREVIATRTVSQGDLIGPFRVKEVSARDVTGLTAVRDPGFPVAAAALAMVAAGLLLALVQGEREAPA